MQLGAPVVNSDLPTPQLGWFPTPPIGHAFPGPGQSSASAAHMAPAVFAATGAALVLRKQRRAHARQKPSIQQWLTSSQKNLCLRAFPPRTVEQAACTQTPEVAVGSGLQEHGQSLADEVRKDFPALQHEAYPGEPLTYLDSAATSQKPSCVLEALMHFYEHAANVHRGTHALAKRATEAYEAARETLARFVGAASGREIVFTSGATDAINLVAGCWGQANLGPGDEVIITVMEHHSNIVPWQLACERSGATLRYVGVTPEGTLDMQAFKQLLSERTKLVAFAHISNVLGCINPVKEIAEAAHAVGAKVLLDACQSVPHFKVDVGDLDVDFLVASGHKMYGPTGVGFLWARSEILDAMPPWKGGGEMIDKVTMEGSTYAQPPARFEAGTPPIVQAIGMAAASEYLTRLGMERVEAYERELAQYLWEQLSSIEGLRLYGPAPSAERERASLVAFNDEAESVYPFDIASALDGDGIAIRAGHHCAQPLHRALGAEFGSARVSCALYNTKAEIDHFVESLRSNLEMLRAGEGCVFDPDDPESCTCADERARS